MPDYIVKKLPCELSSSARLAVVGQCVKRSGVSSRFDRKFPLGIGGISNSDILKSYRGLLVQDRNDFDAVEELSGDSFVTRSLGVGAMLSSILVERTLLSTLAGKVAYVLNP